MMVKGVFGLNISMSGSLVGNEIRGPWKGWWE